MKCNLVNFDDPKMISIFPIYLVHKSISQCLFGRPKIDEFTESPRDTRILVPRQIA